jgi:hypothetical protein
LNHTARFLGPPTGWPAVRLALRDVHGLWGGHALELDGGGRGEVSVVDAGGRARRYPLALDPARAAALFDLLIAHDIVALTFPARPGLPDEARPEIRITNPAGEVRAIAKWANDKDPAFEAIYQALLALAREAAG